MAHRNFSYISCNENDLFAVLRDGSCPFALQVDFGVNSLWFQFEPGGSIRGGVLREFGK